MKIYGAKTINSFGLHNLSFFQWCAPDRNRWRSVQLPRRLCAGLPKVRGHGERRVFTRWVYFIREIVVTIILSVPSSCIQQWRSQLRALRYTLTSSQLKACVTQSYPYYKYLSIHYKCERLSMYTYSSTVVFTIGPGIMVFIEKGSVEGVKRLCKNKHPRGGTGARGRQAVRTAGRC